MRFNLESECKCDRKYRIAGFASFLTIGAGLKGPQLGGVGGSGGPSTFEDPWSNCPDPYAATGFAWASGISAVPGIGGNLLQRIDLGRLRSWGFASGPAYGFDFSIQSSVGFFARSVVTSVEKIDCCSE